MCLNETVLANDRVEPKIRVIRPKLASTMPPRLTPQTRALATRAPANVGLPKHALTERSRHTWRHWRGRWLRRGVERIRWLHLADERFCIEGGGSELRRARAHDLRRGRGNCFPRRCCCARSSPRVLEVDARAFARRRRRCDCFHQGEGWYRRRSCVTRLRTRMGSIRPIARETARSCRGAEAFEANGCSRA